MVLPISGWLSVPAAQHICVLCTYAFSWFPFLHRSVEATATSSPTHTVLWSLKRLAKIRNCSMKIDWSDSQPTLGFLSTAFRTIRNDIQTSRTFSERRSLHKSFKFIFPSPWSFRNLRESNNGVGRLPPLSDQTTVPFEITETSIIVSSRSLSLYMKWRRCQLAHRKFWQWYIEPSPAFELTVLVYQGVHDSIMSFSPLQVSVFLCFQLAIFGFECSVWLNNQRLS